MIDEPKADLNQPYLNEFDLNETVNKLTLFDLLNSTSVVPTTTNADNFDLNEPGPISQ